MSTEKMPNAAPVHPRCSAALLHLHVAWNDAHGEPNRMTALEFGNDCEVCAVETDVLDGDPVHVANHTFVVFQSLEHREKRIGHRFAFRERSRHVGNVMWDSLLMTPQQFGRFAEYIQRQRHWSLNVAAQEIWNSWGSLSGPSVVEMIRELEP